MTNYQCKHNLQYWHNDPYLGLGAGAHGFVTPDLTGFQNPRGLNDDPKSCRYSNVMSPTAYISRMESGENWANVPTVLKDGEINVNQPSGRSFTRPKQFPFSPALGESILIDRKTEMDETMLTGMRLTKEGVGFERFRKRFGVGIEEVYAKEIEELKGKKLIEVDDERVRLTKGGRLVANWVFEKFV
ncbi:MAG: hypothetical protein HZB77_13480 [Chloroflexi bacterium]|nr:hypothetical protein [Chloroflexota bacterium]